MPFKEFDIDALAKKSGDDATTAREKVRVIAEIVRTRKAQGLSQAAFAKLAGLSQARIAQVEGGVGGARVTLDTLLRMLKMLGVEYRISFKRRAA
jgi:transcriptional regulator with XRE-family HTH domain